MAEDPNKEKSEMTLAKLFFSGADNLEVGKDGATNEDVVVARHSWRVEDGPGLLDQMDVMTEFIPDPPCVMPFEDEEDEEDSQHKNLSVQIYWKQYASWLECWPKVKEAKEDMNIFERELEDQKLTQIRCRAYSVVCQVSVGIRSEPTLEEESKTGDVLRPGQCIFVNEIKDRDGVRFLRLKEGNGWVFEAKGDTTVMAEMKSVEVGNWWYRIVCSEFVEVRRTPTFGAEARNGWVMCPKELAVVRLRCRVGGFPFLLLADGRGWIFQQKPGSSKNNKDFDNIVAQECEDDFQVGTETQLLKRLVPATNEVVEVGQWTYVVNQLPVLAIGTRRHGSYLTPGDVVKVDKRAIANGDPMSIDAPKTMLNRRWLRLADKRGWVPEVSPTGQTLLEVQEEKEVSYPAWYPGMKKNLDKPKEDWMIGIV